MNWISLDKVTIFTGKDKDGNRYLTQFVRDYKKVFGNERIEIGCDKCINTLYNNFIKYLNNMKTSKNTKTKAVLKKKYQGIQLCFGSKFFITNANMTQEQAVYLVTKHPHGKKLFDVLPEMKEKKNKDLTNAELHAKYPGLKAAKKADMLAEIEAQKAIKVVK